MDSELSAQGKLRTKNELNVKFSLQSTFSSHKQLEELSCSVEY